MINDNSSAAFATIQDMTVTHQFALLKIVKENPESTAREIELLSGWEINRVTGRVRELLDKNNIIEAGNDTTHRVKRGLLRVA
jgi:hypothetical protein